MGLLILTKAKFFYLFIIILLPLTIFTSSKKRVKSIGILLIGSLIVLSPWLIRNYLLFGEFNIVMRGGDTISKRVLFNQMQKEEIKGALYLWGPELYKDLVVNTHLSVDPNEFKIGGKYERISRGHVIGNHAIRMGMPDKAIDYHSKVRARSVLLKHDYLKKGLDNKSALLQTHNKMKSESIHWIMMNPIKHITMSPLFIWKSIWCFPNSTIPLLSSKLQQYIHNVLNLISYLLIFILFIYGAIKRKKDLIALTLIPVIMLLFLVFVTHSLPRYTQPLIPSMLVSLVHMFGVMTNHFLSQKMVKNSKTLITRFKGFTALISRS
jgi:4-amino-4-deoxy-L-arabinose transferase-like glycosyltransferase